MLLENGKNIDRESDILVYKDYKVRFTSVNVWLMNPDRDKKAKFMMVNDMNSFGVLFKIMSLSMQGLEVVYSILRFIGYRTMRTCGTDKGAVNE